MTDIIADIGKIYSRIFDHRPFLSGELTFFVREFEDKRNDREVENLFEISQTISELKSSGTKKVTSLGESSLTGLQEDLTRTLELCESVSSRQPDPQIGSVLENNRETRKKHWQEFTDDVNHKRHRIDITFEEKEEEITEFYTDLERKLHIHK